MEDCEIIELFFDRSETALREVAQKYGLYCKTIARNILNNSEEADECVNDTYIRAWESIPPKKPPVLRAFLGRITKNLALTEFVPLKQPNAAEVKRTCRLTSLTILFRVNIPLKLRRSAKSLSPR